MAPCVELLVDYAEFGEVVEVFEGVAVGAPCFPRYGCDVEGRVLEEGLEYVDAYLRREAVVQDDQLLRGDGEAFFRHRVSAMVLG